MPADRSRLRVLITTHYYPPEIGASPNRLHQLARYLTERGHVVTVSTGFPNYPSGVIPPEYRGRLVMRETIDGVPILRTWIYPTENTGFVRRLLNHLSFAASAVFASLLIGPIDVVVVESPPLFVAGAGPIIKLLKRAKFVLNVADLWPEAPVAMGMLTNPYAIALATMLEEALLMDCDHVVAVTPHIAEHLVKVKMVPAARVDMHPNSIDAGDYGPHVPPADMSAWFPAEDFAVMYTGTLSMSHGLETA
ncbi:MAG TPA: glycosyltransferase family 4 protein, partial [Chloroflexota bacterium]|nr:glycosyltransferase family 4 protein [Chloroflexota bacterium]